MRIGVIQRDDTSSVLTSSGTLYYMTLALQKHVGDVVQLGPDRTWLSRLLILFAKVFNKASAALFRKRLSPIHQRLLSLNAANVFGPRIREAQCDVLYAPFASVEIANLRTDLPIVYHTDMTWAQAVNYYSIYSSLFAFAKRAGETIQQNAFRKAAVSILPTKWATDSVQKDYGVTASDVFTVAYGANFHAAELPSSSDALRYHERTPVSLLWIGVDWVRKGGLIAYECLLSLLEQGVNANLTVCGCSPPNGLDHPKMTIIPFLKKSDPVQRKRLSDLLLRATFFIFPTLGDAAAIVLCEASAHGLPALVPNTGGLASVIVDGKNGFVLPVDATGKEYADRILQILADEHVYLELLKTSRMEFETRLNWDAWGSSVRGIFEYACGRASQ